MKKDCLTPHSYAIHLSRRGLGCLFAASSLLLKLATNSKQKVQRAHNSRKEGPRGSREINQIYNLVQAC